MVVVVDEMIMIMMIMVVTVVIVMIVMIVMMVFNDAYDDAITTTQSGTHGHYLIATH